MTFLFSDIEGSTRLVQGLGSATYRTVLELHHRLMRGAFSEHGGIERGTEGDSFLVVFEDAPSAVLAAVSAQKRLGEAEWPEAGEVRVRMGLHSGQGIRGADDYVGIDINRAARISAAGHGGQILLSDATRALCERALPQDVAIRDLGEHRLKGPESPERIFQLVVDGLTRDFPPLQTVDVGEAHLPSRMTSFVGRRTELEKLRDLLEENRMITLTGPGGTGKTSLAVELARQVSSRFSDGAWFVDLAPVQDPELVISAVAGALGLVTKTQRPIMEIVEEHLVSRQTLLIMDNYEHVLPAARVVGQLVAQSRGLRVLITSRTALSLYGEQVFPVSPLGLPSASQSADPGDLATREAIALFVERARSASPDFSLTSQNALTVSEICRRLDGLPLAIELAASRVRVLTVDEILGRLDESFPALGSGETDRPRRHQTLEALIEWSHQLLSPVEQSLFARLSVFVGGFTLDGASAVCNPEGELGIDTLDGIASLLNQSLIRRVSDTGSSRFEILETIRQFARGRLQATPAWGEVSRRHVHYFRGLAEAAESFLTTSEEEEWIDRLTLDHGNFRQALRVSLDSGDDDESGLRIASSIWRFWFERGHLHEGRNWLEALLALEGKPVSLPRAKAYTALGGLTYWLADHEATEMAYSRALDIYRQLGDEEAIAEALYNYAFASSMSDDMAETANRMAASLAAAESVGSKSLIARNQVGIGIGVLMAGEVKQAVSILEEAEAVFRETGDRLHIMWVTGNLGFAYIQLGEIEKGRNAMLESLQLAGKMANIPALVAGLRTLALLASAMGKHLDATRLAGAGETLQAETGADSPLPKLVNADLETAQAELGAVAYEQGLEEGRRMSMTEAIDYASDTLDRL